MNVLVKPPAWLNKNAEEIWYELISQFAIDDNWKNGYKYPLAILCDSIYQYQLLISQNQDDTYSSIDNQERYRLQKSIYALMRDFYLLPRFQKKDTVDETANKPKTDILDFINESV